MPRLWFGGDVWGGLRLLKDIGFDLGLRAWLYLPFLGAISAANTLARQLQYGLCFRAVANHRIADPPIYILGHWRSGTTFLHELLALDPRLSFPTTYACLFPNHFLLTERFVMARLGGSPGQSRGIDKVRVGLSSPQEEEIALANLGVPTPYLTAMAPNHLSLYCQYRSPSDLPPRARQAWQERYLQFLRALSYRSGKRLVLKNPTNTFRVPTILEMFPDSHFVHIVRNPYDVFASTMKTLQIMQSAQGLHQPTFADLERFVCERYRSMQERYEATKGLIAPKRLTELRYEDLADNTVNQLVRVYETLDLEPYHGMDEAIETYLAERADIQREGKHLDERTRRLVTEQWGSFITAFGYETRC